MTDNYAFWRSLIRGKISMTYFLSKPEEKRESPSMKVWRDFCSLSQNIKWHQFVNIQNIVLGQKMPVFSENFKIQHPFVSLPQMNDLLDCKWK